MTSRNGLRKLPNQSLEKRKNVFELKNQKWSGNGPLNKKIFQEYLTITKVVPEVSSKTKNKFRSPEVF